MNNLIKRVIIPNSRIVDYLFTCWLFYNLLLLGVISLFALVLLIYSLLVTLDSQLILIELTAIPIILGSVTLLAICLYLIIFFAFYVPFLDIVTNI